MAFLVVLVGAAAVGVTPAHAAKSPPNPCGGTPGPKSKLTACNFTAPPVVAGGMPADITLSSADYYNPPGSAPVTVIGIGAPTVGAVGIASMPANTFVYTPPVPRYPPTGYSATFTYTISNNTKNKTPSTATVTVPITQPPLGATVVAGVPLSAPFGGVPTTVEFGVRNAVDSYGRTASYRLVVSGAGRSYTYVPTILDGGVYVTDVQLVPCTYTASVVDLTDGPYVAPVSTTVNVIGADKAPRCRSTAAAAQVSGTGSSAAASPALGSPASAALARALRTSAARSGATSAPVAGGTQTTTCACAAVAAGPGSAAFSDAANETSPTPGRSMTEPLLFGAVGLAVLVGIAAFAATLLERRRVGS